MKRFVPVLALALAVVLPLGAAARTKHAAGGAMAATAPSSVTCAAGDPVVWVNTETKVFHMPGSSYYGKTKHGKYACQSDATKMGAHAAKRESGMKGGTSGGAMGGGTSGSSGGTMGSASGSSGGTMGGSNGTVGGTGATSDGSGGSSGKHHRKHHKPMGSPAPMSPMTSPTPM